MPRKRTKSYQVSPGDDSNCNQSFKRHQVIQRWKSLDPTPQLAIEPAKHWPGRWVIAITQKRTRWELVPSLSHSEALDLESLLKGSEISLELDMNHGIPLAGEEIHGLVECYLSHPWAFASVVRSDRPRDREAVEC